MSNPGDEPGASQPRVPDARATKSAAKAVGAGAIKRAQAARADRKRAERDRLASSSISASLRPSSAAGAVAVMAIVLAVVWAVVGIDAILDDRLLRFGIKPRELGGLWGILTSPVLHANAPQLGGNTIPLAVFGWLMLVSGLRYFVVVTASVWLVTGVVTWAAGPSHEVILGASALIFGWFGYVLARALFGRKIVWIAVAIAVVTVFSGMFGGLLPKAHHNVFWGGQLVGFLTGLGLGAVLHNRGKGTKSDVLGRQPKAKSR